MAITASIKERQQYGDRNRVKVLVTLDNGTVRDYWPYVTVDKPDAEIEADAIVAVQAQLDAVIEDTVNQPVDRSEVDAVIAKLRTAGSIESDDEWEDLRDNPILTRTREVIR